MRKLIFLLPLLVGLLSSCGKEEKMMARLGEIDSLLYTHPDSAYTLLQDACTEVASLSDEVRAYYDLLQVRADDKTFRQHTTDSVIMRVVDFYERKNDRRKLAMAYHYAGRVYSDVDASGKRDLYYSELALLCDSTWPDDYWRSRIFAQKGYVYLRAGLYEDAKEMQEMARIFCQHVGDTMGVRYCTEDIATVDSLMQAVKRDTAIVQAKRQAYQVVLERAHNKMLRLANEQQKMEATEGGKMPWAIVAGVISSLCGVGIVLSRRKRQKAAEETTVGVAQEPVGRAFYDAEVDELMQTRLKTDKALKAADWKFIEERLLTAFPDFRNRLYSLYELSDTEYRICLLIKMQTSNSNMAQLLAMGKSSVSQSRLRMQQKVFDGKGTAKDWDVFVASL